MLVPTAYPAAVHADGLSRTRPGRAQALRLEQRRRQPVVPPHTPAISRFAQASPALDGERLARRAIALWSHDMSDRRFGWRRAPQLPGDRRCRPPESASDLLHRGALYAKKRVFRRSRHSNIRGLRRGQIIDGVSIANRAPEIEDRAIPGHWEGDLIAGRGNTHIATLVERHSRFTMLVKVSGKDTNTVVRP